ncbi:hypothetical protein [Wenzhouxiangella limi]|uniref:Nuclear transport factor 2 family protein n=1 Tax=Wenzhouxiangella limi TaxID=2707351 RepID=A0A845UT29_9GAMM|nr:hypothetical protein [Wenzhouxiangella limi]NDY94973.1 hypothetical protein [Wenzhouxiangella limi]
MKNKLLKIPVALGLALALSACGGPAEPEQTLEERVMARWQHMIERDFEAAWEYYTPGFQQTTPREDFADDMGRRPIRWQSSNLIRSECEKESCSVWVEVEYQPVGAPGPLREMRPVRINEERWLQIEGQWWFSPT